MKRRSLWTIGWLILFMSFASPLRSALGQGLATLRLGVEQPSDVRLQVQTATGRTRFQIGEIIPLKLSFTSSAAKKYQINMATYDRSGRMGYEQFLTEPEAGWTDPLLAFFAYDESIGGGGSTFRLLSKEPAVIPLDLNEWVRFDRPGRYTLRVVSRRVEELSKGSSYPQISGSELTSNVLELTIIPAAESWQQETLKEAVSILDLTRQSDVKPGPPPGEIRDAQTARKALRYLGTPEAAKQLAMRFRGEDFNVDLTCMLGLIGSPAYDVALGEMQRLLSDPDYPVSSMFVHALVVLMRNADQSPEKHPEDEKRNVEIVRNQLRDAVSHKRGKALSLSLNVLLEMENYWVGKPLSEHMASQLEAVFDQLPLNKQGELLEYRWDLIKSPVFLPMLRKYSQQYDELTVPNEANGYDSLHLTGLALRRWYELEPNEARTVIIQEIVRPRPRFSARILGILPDKTLPEVEEALAEHFAADEPGYATENLASLLNRYATDSVLPQILGAVDKHVGKWACAVQAPILAYLLRVNPEVARSRIEAAMAARGDGYSACKHGLLAELGPLQQSPILEEIAVQRLDDADLEVAGNAAAYLAKYGSPAAEHTLWEHLTHWNERWNGKAERLRSLPGETNPNLPQSALGMNLALALAGGKSWLSDQSKLLRLRQLAVGPDMQRQLDRLLGLWERLPWQISYIRDGDQTHFIVLQYDTYSIKDIEEKLAQFAPGSNFTWVKLGGGLPAEEEKRIVRELSEFLASHDMKLTGPAN